MIIAIDAFGSDNAPSPEVEGAVAAIKENICDKIILVGNKDLITDELNQYKYELKRISIVQASEVISMSDKASRAVRKKKDSSLVKAINLQKDKKVNAVVSAGNTGAAMAASLFAYGRINNVSRPAIATNIPTIDGHPKLIMDVGANADCNENHLHEFALLGSLYFHFFYGKEKPRISLLNIGEEPEKGNELSKKTYKLLSEDSHIFFQGNEEGKDILTGNSDVVICDGFVGNVVLKTVEGTATSIVGMLKSEIKKRIVSKFGAILLLPVFKALKNKMDHSSYGGALLVGLNGNTIVAHGRSNGKAIKNAVKMGVKISESGFVEHAKEYFKGLKK
ncbi:MAG: phosphate acyltransferase PlsX [Candidatus Cloacimonadota bacterium]|nr:phosphate acyltransferase PlsX [Candidatus Cloacimonadota bacterium]